MTQARERRLRQAIATLPRRGRALARHGALDGLEWLTRSKLEAALRAPRVHLPYLHTVPAPDEDAFRSLLTYLREHHTFITYSEAVERIMNGPIDRPYISFSFDDGFKSNMRTAKILEEYGTRGMFFVPPNFIGTRDPTEARKFFPAMADTEVGAMTWDDLQTLLADGHEVGNHTLDHKVLSWLDESEMLRQIEMGAESLRVHLGDIRHFAWPRGQFQHFTEAAARAVFATEHETIASAERGAHAVPAMTSKEALCLRRDHLVTEWPLRHSLYFLGRSSRHHSSPDSNHWPRGWHV